MDDKGYYKKFEIKRTDGQPLPENSEHFVLRLDSDQAAREAALFYARITGNCKLEHDLYAMFSNKRWQFDPNFDLKGLNCFSCGETPGDSDEGLLIGELRLDPGESATRWEPGCPEAPYFICHKCKAEMHD